MIFECYSKKSHFICDSLVHKILILNSNSESCRQNVLDNSGGNFKRLNLKTQDFEHDTFVFRFFQPEV